MRHHYWLSLPVWPIAGLAPIGRRTVSRERMDLDIAMYVHAEFDDTALAEFCFVTRGAILSSSLGARSAIQISRARLKATIECMSHLRSYVRRSLRCRVQKSAEPMHSI